MKTITKAAKLIRKNSDTTIIVSHKYNHIKIRSGYFYRHGRTADSVADQICSRLNLDYPEFIFNVDAARDNWAPWPKDSYFETTLTVRER